MKTRRLYSVIFVLLLLAGCAQPAAQPGETSAPSGEMSAQSSTWPTQDWPVSTPMEQGMDAAALQAMLDQVDADKLSLHSLLVIRHGAIVLEKYYPGHKQSERHTQYSVTKSFVSTLFGIALDQGKIKGVEQPVRDFFPGKTFANPDPRKDAMTLEHLLSMTSGLGWEEGDPAYSAMYRSADWVEWVMGLPQVEAPGEAFNYCSGCSHVLLQVVEQAVGGGAIDFARQNLLGPLGIRDFDWERSPQGDAIGGWGLSLTARDMAKLGYLYLHNGQWDGRQVVSADWVRAATTQHADPEGRLGYGYQWWLYDTHGAYAALGKAGQTIFVIPDLDVIVVTTADIPDHDPIFALIDAYIIPAVKD
ncbi:MAG TPA: serine hydrolase [Anaerolinea sp.]|nr:serine hydrolase [Anaerolinea sp.]